MSEASVRVPIDYAASNREFRQQKSVLTRAVNSGNPDNVAAACEAAVKAWNRPGRAWPDEWSRWQRALDDAMPWSCRVDLRDLA